MEEINKEDTGKGNLRGVITAHRLPSRDITVIADNEAARKRLEKEKG